MHVRFVCTATLFLACERRFVVGISGTVFMVFWAFFAYDSPAAHPRISDEERAYIEAALPESDATDQV